MTWLRRSLILTSVGAVLVASTMAIAAGPPPRTNTRESGRTARAARAPSDDNLVSGNTANSNGSAGGILLDGSVQGNRLRGNTANANAGYGITAISGTIDAGANHARGNRHAPQCIGVVCA